MQGTGKQGRTLPSRNWLFLLGTSLAINLLVAGILLARWIDRDVPPRPMPHHMHWVLGGLTREERTELRPQFRQSFQASSQAFRRVRNAQRAVWQLAMAEHLDEAALRDALARLRSETARSQALMHETLLEIMANLDPDQRRRVTRFLHHKHSSRTQRQDGRLP